MLKVKTFILRRASAEVAASFFQAPAFMHGVLPLPPARVPLVLFLDQTLKEQKFAIKVPICKCEFNNKTNKWTPKTDNVMMEVFATSQLQANQLAQLHLENARQAADLCLARNTEEPIAAIPQSWQIRHEGGKPQLVIHCAEKKEDGKYGSAMYPITVPHWKGGVNDKPALPPYKKGNWEGILVLADNTKVTINAANEAECTKILNAIKPWIKSEMLLGSYFKGEGQSE